MIKVQITNSRSVTNTKKTGPFGVIYSAWIKSMVIVVVIFILMYIIQQLALNFIGFTYTDLFMGFCLGSFYQIFYDRFS